MIGSVPRSHSGRGAPQSCPLTSHTFWGTYMFCGTHMPTLSLTHTTCTQYPFPCFSCLNLRGPKSWLRMVGHRRRGRARLQTLLHQASGTGQGLFYQITFRDHLSGVPQQPCCDLLLCQESPSKGPCSQCPVCHPMPFHSPVSAISLYPKIWIASPPPPPPIACLK